MQELQTRVLRHIYQTSSARPDGRIVMVSHAEPIRAAVLHVLKLSLDEFWRIEIAPASVSTLIVQEDSAEFISVNETVAA